MNTQTNKSALKVIALVSELRCVFMLCDYVCKNKKQKQEEY